MTILCLPDWAQSEDCRVYLRPFPAAPTMAGDDALVLAGGPLRFERAQVIVRHSTAGTAIVTGDVADLRQIADSPHPLARRLAVLLARSTVLRPAVAGIDLARPRIMGIVNVTPDSFSDGGDFLNTQVAVAHGVALLEAGADILDIGGESTRPGAAAVSPDEEVRRTQPVVRALAERGAVVSIDTRNAAVMEAALAAGAAIINDVSALAHDPGSLALAARTACPIVLMHMRGEPGTMQQAPVYENAPLDVFDTLESRVEACEAVGIDRTRLIVDPGIGFGKTVEHNIHILNHGSLFLTLGCAVLFGVSRKTFIGRLSRSEPPKHRLAGSLAAGLASLDQGAHLLRVHDVAETRQAVSMWCALREAA